MASPAVLGGWGMQQTGRHGGYDCHPCAEAQGSPQCRGSTREAASTAVCFPFSSSHDFHCFLPQVCLLNSLLWRTCLSFPHVSLPCHLWSPLFPLSFSLTSTPGACPRDMAHRALRHMCPDCTFAGHYGKRVCSFSCPLAGRLYLCFVEALWRGEEACSACPLSGESGSHRKPSCWRSWAEGLEPALWLPQTNPKPNMLISMNDCSLGKRSHFSGGTWHLFAHTQLHHRKVW